MLYREEKNISGIRERCGGDIATGNAIIRGTVGAVAVVYIYRLPPPHLTYNAY